MRNLFPVAALAALGLLPGTTPATAEVLYPWCAQYGGWDGGGTNCGFSTYEQCRATVSGIGGYCQENPMYRPAAPGQPVPRRQRR